MFITKLVFCFCVVTQTYRIRSEPTSFIYASSNPFWTGLIQHVDTKIRASNER